MTNRVIGCLSLVVWCLFFNMRDAAWSESVFDHAVRLSATVQSNPPRLILSWPGDAGAPNVILHRKARDDTDWGAGTALPANATNYVDSNIVVGTPIEYRLSKI